MGFLRELGINNGWIKPKPGEFLREHQELGLAYQIFDMTFKDSRRELDRKPEEEDMVRDAMGAHIKARALRVVRAGLLASYYRPDLPGPHEILIANDYLFSFRRQDLFIAPAEGVSVHINDLVEAKPRVWFEHGKTVVDATLAHLIDRRGLARYLSRIETLK